MGDSCSDWTPVGSSDCRQLGLTTNTVSTTPYTINPCDNMVAFDCSVQAISVQLLAAAAYKNRVFIIKKADSTTNQLIISADTGPGELINGQSSYVLSWLNQAITIVSDGINWSIL